MSKLKELHLSNNQLTVLPPEIGRLTKLYYLDLTGNQLTALPPELGRLTRLGTLDREEQELIEHWAEPDYWAEDDELGERLGRKIKLERKLQVSDNPLISPPPAIVEQGAAAIIAYLRAQLESVCQQWVAKLVVVGEGGVGKTSLLRRLRGEPFVAGESTTHGIEGRSLQLPHPDLSGVTMELSAWDFGGQEIYHATHQFFLTDGALFLLVWNARLGYQQGRLAYWLDTIRARAPRSPVLLVATHTDERQADLPLADLRRRHPQIVGHCATSNATGSGIDELRSQLQSAAARLPLMGEKWPTRWLRAAEAISNLSYLYLTLGQMHALLAEHEVAGEKAGVLLQWLHERGALIHFRDDPELNDLVLLKPHWLSQVIGRVLESPEVVRSGGLFTRQAMQSVWADVEPVLRDHLLRMMERFDLSYRTAEDRQTSLVIERLPLDPPAYQPLWDGITKRGAGREMARTFHLGTLPAGIPSWFIAREHRFSIGMHWRYGVLLADGPARRHLALVEAVPTSTLFGCASAGHTRRTSSPC